MMIEGAADKLFFPGGSRQPLGPSTYRGERCRGSPRLSWRTTRAMTLVGSFATRGPV